ncbi:hypothetical protein F8M41_015581 [Gigaspora margarita]|uniref:Uncharacterized protein n=1 Tax=Gigaspora margarita TaxID=4874 RepID=A0A8H4AQF5_GIGMA|nr:hypothetical protein F8M41_015581 [Gigaspora margarita]
MKEQQRLQMHLITNNYLKEEEGRILAKTLYKNTTLTSLDLGRRNLFANVRLRPNNINALGTNNSLISLCLINNQLHPNGGITLAKALHFDYSGYFIQSGCNKEGFLFVEALGTNNSLTYLILLYNQFSSMSKKELAKAHKAKIDNIKTSFIHLS